MSEADGQEVLVVDGDESVRRGMQSLLTDLGVVPTVLGDVERAQELVRDKYFAAAIIDLDTPRTNGALELLAAIRKDAPGTTLVVLTARKVYEAAVDAFRAGASDVIVKAPGEIEYLKRRVLEACLHVRLSETNERVLTDVFSLHEDFLKRLMETSRRAAELEERLGGGAQSTDADEETRLLVVEPADDPWLADSLGQALESRPGYRMTRVHSGGEALDVGAAKKFHIALVRDHLPDLPSSMIVTTLRAQSPETITILFSRPGTQAGKAEVVEGSRVIPLLGELTDGSQLAARLEELREAFVGKSRERRYLAAFRQQNYELLRRFADLKHKLKRAVDATGVDPMLWLLAVPIVVVAAISIVAMLRKPPSIEGRDPQQLRTVVDWRDPAALAHDVAGDPFEQLRQLVGALAEKHFIFSSSIDRSDRSDPASEPVAIVDVREQRLELRTRTHGGGRWLLWVNEGGNAPNDTDDLRQLLSGLARTLEDRGAEDVHWQRREELGQSEGAPSPFFVA